MFIFDKTVSSEYISTLLLIETKTSDVKIYTLWPSAKQKWQDVKFH